MGKLKELREARATVFAAIDELRKATDGREMTAEEQQRWDALLADYDKADRKVEQEERFEEPGTPSGRRAVRTPSRG